MTQVQTIFVLDAAFPIIAKGMSLDHPDGITRLRYIVHRLRAPGGCPWDIEQTHESLIPHVLEEAYEVVDAIKSGNPELICEELGDLLLQPVLHADGPAPPPLHHNSAAGPQPEVTKIAQLGVPTSANETSDGCIDSCCSAGPPHPSTRQQRNARFAPLRRGSRLHTSHHV